MGEVPSSSSSADRRRHHCAFCPKSFKKEVKLLLHFKRKHLPPEEDGDDDDDIKEEEEESPSASSRSAKKRIKNEDVDPDLDPSGAGAGDESSLYAQVEDLFNRRGMGEAGDGGGNFGGWEELEEDDQELSYLDENTCAQLLCAWPFLFRGDPPTVSKKGKKKTELKLDPDLEELIQPPPTPTDGGRSRPIRRRRKKVWTGDEPYVCVFCNKVFKPDQRAMFYYHLNVHTKEKPYFCEWCDESFGRPNYLTKHTRLHVGPNAFPCPLCKIGFSEVSYLKTHLNRTHSRKKSIKCTECDKGFYDQNKLDRHMLIHTGEKNFKCKKCKKRFSRADALKQHMLLIHNPLKPHECTICEERFAIPELLTMHNDLMHSDNVKMRRKLENSLKKSPKSAEFVYD